MTVDVFGFVSVFAYKSNLEFKREMRVRLNVIFHCVDALKNLCSIYFNLIILVIHFLLRYAFVFAAFTLTAIT